MNADLTVVCRFGGVRRHTLLNKTPTELKHILYQFVDMQFKLSFGNAFVVHWVSQDLRARHVNMVITTDSDHTFIGKEFTNALDSIDYIVKVYALRVKKEKQNE